MKVHLTIELDVPGETTIGDLVAAVYPPTAALCIALRPLGKARIAGLQGVPAAYETLAKAVELAVCAKGVQ